MMFKGFYAQYKKSEAETMLLVDFTTYYYRSGTPNIKPKSPMFIQYILVLINRGLSKQGYIDKPETHTVSQEKFASFCSILFKRLTYVFVLKGQNRHE